MSLLEKLEDETKLQETRKSETSKNTKQGIIYEWKTSSLERFVVGVFCTRGVCVSGLSFSCLLVYMYVCRKRCISAEWTMLFC